jgi:hypothetical protein
MENLWVKRIMYSLAIAVFQLALIKVFKFSFWAILVLFLLLGFLMKILEHKNFAWSILIGTILFGLGMSIFGWTIMEGWVKPEDFFNGK